MPPPRFLAVPDRPAKPRDVALTHVLDQGLTLPALRDVLAAHADHVDIWKAGWGTAYLDPAAAEKQAELARHGILGCLGGTLLEIAWQQGAAAECLAWAADVGFGAVEVSRGTVAMPPADKRNLIEAAAARFTVLAEVGSKDPDDALSLRQWAGEAAADLAAGAALVVTEGRQSGTVGVFDRSGRVREHVVEAVVDAVGVAQVVFEAPRPAQQAWFVRRFGPAVNLGNVAPDDVLAVETLRLGLRSDTVRLAPDAARAAGSER